MKAILTGKMVRKDGKLHGWHSDVFPNLHLTSSPSGSNINKVKFIWQFEGTLWIINIHLIKKLNWNSFRLATLLKSSKFLLSLFMATKHEVSSFSLVSKRFVSQQSLDWPMLETLEKYKALREALRRRIVHWEGYVEAFRKNTDSNICVDM